MSEQCKDCGVIDGHLGGCIAWSIIGIPKPNPVIKRGDRLFDDASSTINGARQTTYGNPEDSFRMIAERWNQFLKCRYGFERELTAEDIAFMMADFKMARECNQHKRDNLVDASGYLGITDDLVAANAKVIPVNEPHPVDEVEPIK